ncbi:hypothetical protein BCV70DRAFT_48991 [Testicularia cyperi]|uniref:Uncharacterized protein n=1 Tax=Testicularia cyperi TaxID=1882483 RepID=A0A317XIM3_9BASI|nr:hypothetical protein BCV70DRAFT_48991 [Testicularia cyperi]
MAVAASDTSSAQIASKSFLDDKRNPTIVSTMSSEEVSSPDEISGGTASSHSANSSKPQLKGILNNPNEALPRKSRSGSQSGFKAALKSTFLPPPTPGRQIKVKDGKPLGKTFRRCEPLPDAFEGGEVLPFDPRGDDASVGDGVVPPECLRRQASMTQRSDSISDSGYNSDQESSAATESDFGDASELSQSYTTEKSSLSEGMSQRGRGNVPKTSRAREGSVASTTSSGSSAAAIKFAPLPVSGRLKRANSITIGVAARSQLLQSQGTAAPQRPPTTPQHVHNSQYWYTGGSKPEDVVDVGEEIRKGASKAWKLLRGGSGSETLSTQAANPTAAPLEKPHKQFPKEGAPVTDPETGELKMAGGDPKETPRVPPKTLSAIAEANAKGDETPKRTASPTSQLEDLSLCGGKGQNAEADEAAAAIESAHQKNLDKGEHLPNGHHPHELEEGPQHDSFHLAEDHDAQAGSGAATPRSGMQRRLSTGTFLRGLSLRGIQETRRRDVLGLDADDVEDGADGDADARKNSGEHRHGITVRGPSGREEELGLEGYGHTRMHPHEPQQV